MVDVQRRGKRPLFTKPSDPIGRSPLVLVARADRAPVLQATPSCNATVDWKCVGSVAGRSWTDLPGGQAAWGTVKPGPGDPALSATALLVASQATSEFLDKTDYARDDLESDQYLDWVSGIERAVPKLPPTAASPFAEMVQQLPTATYDVVGTTEAEAGPGIADAAPDRRRALTLLYPEPVVTADVVLAAVATSPSRDDAEGLADDANLAAALAQHGWRVPGQPNARGVRDTPALPRGIRPSSRPRSAGRPPGDLGRSAEVRRAVGAALAVLAAVTTVQAVAPGIARAADCVTVDMEVVAGEGRPPDRSGQALQRLGPRQPRWRVHHRARGAEIVGRSRVVTGRRLAEPQGERTAAGRVVAGVERVGSGREPTAG